MKAGIAAELFGDTAAPLQIGRYEVREAIGEGGMGVVFSAWDATLGRLVALKLVGGASPKNAHQRARMVREAKAMAQLSHQNVVHVYEVGDHDGDVFVAMELIDGMSLEAWLSEGQHPVDRIFEVFQQAGRGLAAAHAAGLVHRDFKPSNAILGLDGRVRVLDFGLAVSTGQSTESLPDTGPSSGLSHEKLTRTGAVLGTPAYMAPEQFRGESADARADQFAFCVALFTAVNGERPYSIATLRDNPESASIINWASVPRTWRSALARGLSIAPLERWPSMEALLTALRRGRRWARRGPWLGMGVLAIAGGLPFISTSDDACDSLPSPNEIWSAQVQTQVHKSFANTGAPYAENAWSTAASGVEDFLGRWEGTRGKVCTGQVDKAQLRCLERSAIVFDAVVTEYAAVDSTNIARVYPLVSLLRSPEHCENPAVDDVVAELDHDILIELEAGRAQVTAGRGDAASRTLTALIQDPRLTSTDALADAYRLRAKAMRLLSNRAAALDDLASSLREGRDAVTRGRTIVLWLAELTLQERWGSARDALRLVDAHITDSMPLDLRADAARAQGVLLTQQQHPAEAVSLFERGIELRSGLGNPFRVADLQLNLAAALMEGDESDQERALGLFREAIETYEARLGRTHPVRAAALYDLGLLHADTRGDLASAERFLREAYEVEAATLPLQSTTTARTRVKLASVLLSLGRLEEAIPHAEAAWPVMRQLPPTNSDHIAALSLLANISLATNDHDAALKHHTALAKATPEDPFVRQNLADLHIKLGHPAAAKKALAQTRSLIADAELDEETAELFEMFLRGLDAELLVAEGKRSDGLAMVDELLDALSEPDQHSDRPDLAALASDLQRELQALRERLITVDP